MPTLREEGPRPSTVQTCHPVSGLWKPSPNLPACTCASSLRPGGETEKGALFSLAHACEPASPGRAALPQPQQQESPQLRMTTTHAFFLGPTFPLSYQNPVPSGYFIINWSARSLPVGPQPRSGIALPYRKSRRASRILLISPERRSVGPYRSNADRSRLCPSDTWKRPGSLPSLNLSFEFPCCLDSISSVHALDDSRNGEAGVDQYQQSGAYYPQQRF